MMPSGRSPARTDMGGLSRMRYSSCGTRQQSGRSGAAGVGEFIMPKKRGNNEGTIVRRKDGRWMASITIGRNPETGKPKRAYFYGKTRQEASDQMAHALSDLGRGAFVAPH